MDQLKFNNSISFLVIINIVLLIVLVITTLFSHGLWGMGFNHNDFDHQEHHQVHNESASSIDNMRSEFISLKETMIGQLISDEQYACCLAKPCTYCLEKTPGHGEGASCRCLDDVVNGRHPCGECIGEILEGHGNPWLAQYFASALAEEVGETHLKTLKSIISEKYSISPDKLFELEKAGVRIERSPLPRIFAVFFNQNQASVFTNMEVRKALNIALDKDRIVQEILGGYGTNIDGPIPPGLLDLPKENPKKTLK